MLAKWNFWIDLSHKCDHNSSKHNRAHNVRRHAPPPCWSYIKASPTHLLHTPPSQRTDLVSSISPASFLPLLLASEAGAWLQPWQRSWGSELAWLSVELELASEAEADSLSVEATSVLASLARNQHEQRKLSEETHHLPRRNQHGQSETDIGIRVLTKYFLQKECSATGMHEYAR